jgi:hypothetical protein
MTNSHKTSEKQASTGKFAPGNKIGPRFQKGTSGNPHGRPKLTKLTDALRQQLSENNPDAPESTIAEEIAKTLIKLALSGDVQAVKEIGNRTEGLPKQSIDLDMAINDWRTLAQNYGVNETDVIHEARLLIESIDGSSGE